eukprot:2278650-Rhodomonas_salina.2
MNVIYVKRSRGELARRLSGVGSRSTLERNTVLQQRLHGAARAHPTVTVDISMAHIRVHMCMAYSNPSGATECGFLYFSLQCTIGKRATARATTTRNPPIPHAKQKGARWLATPQGKRERCNECLREERKM